MVRVFFFYPEHPTKMRDTNSCKRFDKTSLSFKVFFYYCSGNFKVWNCFDFDIEYLRLTFIKIGS